MEAPKNPAMKNDAGTDFNHPGVVITAAGADEGYDFWDAFNNHKATKVAERPSFPASAPDVISVGGTTLHLNSENKRESEPVWNGDGPANENKGSGHIVDGGGCSTLYTAQSWQQNALGWSKTGCGSKRLDDDVSADSGSGLSVFDNYNCGEACEKAHFGIPGHEWIAVGGTSLSSPILAAMFGLAGGSGGVSYPAATLYSHLGESSAFFDVTEGGDGYCDGAPESTCGKPNVTFKELLDCEGTLACDAAAGFDGPSGVGVPKGLYGLRADDFTAVTQTSATLNSRVNPDGSNVTACKFEYGTSSGYGKDAECKALPGAGDAPVLVSAAVTGLSANTEYHFRISTTNGKGTLQGPDIVLRTRVADRALGRNERDKRRLRERGDAVRERQPPRRLREHLQVRIRDDDLLRVERLLRLAAGVRVEPGGRGRRDRLRAGREHRIPLPDLGHELGRDHQRDGRDVQDVVGTLSRYTARRATRSGTPPSPLNGILVMAK